MSDAPWNTAHADLLLWLAKEDSSLVGECVGETLRALHLAGFVRIVRATASGNMVVNTTMPLKDRDRITLTGDGWRRVSQIRARLGQ